MIPIFRSQAAGYTDVKKRSLLSSMENYATLLLQAGKPIYSPSFAYSILRRFLPDAKVEGVKGLSLTADGKAAVFDVPADDVDSFIAGQENANMVNIEVLEKLPPLQDKDRSRFGGRFGGGGGRRFSDGRADKGGPGRRKGSFSSGGKGGNGGRNRSCFLNRCQKASVLEEKRSNETFCKTSVKVKNVI